MLEKARDLVDFIKDLDDNFIEKYQLLEVCKVV